MKYFKTDNSGEPSNPFIHSLWTTQNGGYGKENPAVLVVFVQ
jgi:hypothetical protein